MSRLKSNPCPPGQDGATFCISPKMATVLDTAIEYLECGSLNTRRGFTFALLSVVIAIIASTPITCRSTFTQRSRFQIGIKVTVKRGTKFKLEDRRCTVFATQDLPIFLMSKYTEQIPGTIHPQQRLRILYTITSLTVRQKSFLNHC
jgi:hypothetical protein